MTQFIWRLVSCYAMRMSGLVSAWHEFLLRCFFIKVAFNIIFNYKFLCVKKCNCPRVYLEIPHVRALFSCLNQSVGIPVTTLCGRLILFIKIL